MKNSALKIAVSLIIFSTFVHAMEQEIPEGKKEIQEKKYLNVLKPQQKPVITIKLAKILNKTPHTYTLLISNASSVIPLKDYASIEEINSLIENNKYVPFNIHSNTYYKKKFVKYAKQDFPTYFNLDAVYIYNLSAPIVQTDQFSKMYLYSEELAKNGFAKIYNLEFLYRFRSPGTKIAAKISLIDKAQSLEIFNATSDFFDFTDPSIDKVTINVSMTLNGQDLVESSADFGIKIDYKGQ